MFAVPCGGLAGPWPRLGEAGLRPRDFVLTRIADFADFSGDTHLAQAVRDTLSNPARHGSERGQAGGVEWSR